MENIRYAIIDMDGTLVDSMKYWMGVVEESLALLPPDANIPPEALEKILTMGISRAREYLESLHIKADYAFGEEKVREIMGAHYEHDVTVRPGARELLESLKKQGVRMVIATLTPRPLVDLCLERFGLTEYFEAYYTPEEYPEGKRETRIFFDIMKHFGVSSPEDVWLFEDSLYSVKTAKALGMHIVVTDEETQRHNKEQLIALADAYYTDGFTTRIK